MAAGGPAGNPAAEPRDSALVQIDTAAVSVQYRAVDAGPEDLRRVGPLEPGLAHRRERGHAPADHRRPAAGRRAGAARHLHPVDDPASGGVGGDRQQADRHLGTRTTPGSTSCASRRARRAPRLPWRRSPSRWTRPGRPRESFASSGRTPPSSSRSSGTTGSARSAPRFGGRAPRRAAAGRALQPAVQAGQDDLGEHRPMDSVWRTGANAATVLTAGADILLGGKPVRAASTRSTRSPPATHAR